MAEALERAASALAEDADRIRPANGDAYQLLESLGAQASERLLVWLLANEPVAAKELVDVWLQEEAGVAILRALSEEGLPKQGRKLLRRVQHQLRSRGIEIESGPVLEHVARLPRIEESFGAAYVSLPDSEGMQLVYVVESTANAGGRIIETLLDPGLGIFRFSAFRASRGEAQRFLRSARQSEGKALVSVEPKMAKALLARTASKQSEQVPLPRGFIESRHVFDEVASEKTPGEAALAALADLQESSLSSDEAAEDVVAELMSRLGPWAPDPARLALLQAGSESETEAVSEAPREILLEKAAAILLVPEVLSSLAARFREAAYVLWKRDEQKDAQACAAAVQLLATGVSMDDPLGRAFVEGVLKHLAQKATHPGRT